jgi:23S rRNA (pseudouridine1915-N3)-methyltransferase
MRITILAIGRSQPGPERDLTDRYIERIHQLSKPHGLSIRVRELPQSRKSRAADRIAEEGEVLEAATPDRAKSVVLDENGKSLTSAELANRAGIWRDAGVGELVFILGGPDGLAADLVNRADLVLAFGRLSWPHQLARAMLAEQIYRIITIWAGHPYHRQ